MVELNTCRYMWRDREREKERGKERDKSFFARMLFTGIESHALLRTLIESVMLPLCRRCMSGDSSTGMSSLLARFNSKVSKRLSYITTLLKTEYDISVLPPLLHTLPHSLLHALPHSLLHALPHSLLHALPYSPPCSTPLSPPCSSPLPPPLLHSLAILLPHYNLCLPSLLATSQHRFTLTHLQERSTLLPTTPIPISRCCTATWEGTHNDD